MDQVNASSVDIPLLGAASDGGGTRAAVICTDPSQAFADSLFLGWATFFVAALVHVGLVRCLGVSSLCCPPTRQLRDVRAPHAKAWLSPVRQAALAGSEACALGAVCGLVAVLVPRPVIVFSIVAATTVAAWCRLHAQRLGDIGLVSLCGPDTRRSLLETRFLDWLRAPSLTVALGKYLPFFWPGVGDEGVAQFLRRAPPAFRSTMLRRGLVHRLPSPLAAALLPRDGGGHGSPAASHDDGDGAPDGGEGITAATVALPPSMIPPKAALWAEGFLASVRRARVERGLVSADDGLARAAPSLTRAAGAAGAVALLVLLVSSRARSDASSLVRRLAVAGPASACALLLGAAYVSARWPHLRQRLMAALAGAGL